MVLLAKRQGRHQNGCAPVSTAVTINLATAYTIKRGKTLALMRVDWSSSFVRSINKTNTWLTHPLDGDHRSREPLHKLHVLRRERQDAMRHLHAKGQGHNVYFCTKITSLRCRVRAKLNNSGPPQSCSALTTRRLVEARARTWRQTFVYTSSCSRPIR